MVCALGVSGSTAQAQENIDPELYRYGEVTSIINTEYPIMQGREVELQTLEIQFADGSFMRDVYNDYTPLEVGDTAYFSPAYNPVLDKEGYFIEEVDRVGVLALVFFVLWGCI